MLNATLIPFELPLPPILPTIEGNVDYRDFRDQLLRLICGGRRNLRGNVVFLWLD